MERQLALLKMELTGIPSSGNDSSIKEIEAGICSCLDIPPKVIHGTSKTRDISNARFIVYWALYRWGYTYTSIGNYFNRSHCTARHGVKVIENALQVNDKEIRILVDKVAHLININNKQL